MTKEEALEIIKKAPLYDDTTWTYANKLHEAIKTLEQESKVSHWVHDKGNASYKEHWICYNCHSLIFENPVQMRYNWCPCCGAKMAESER